MTSDNSDTIFKQFDQKQTVTIESRARWTQKQDAQGLKSKKTLISGNQADQGKKKIISWKSLNTKTEQTSQLNNEQDLTTTNKKPDLKYMQD